MEKRKLVDAMVKKKATAVKGAPAAKGEGKTRRKKEGPARVRSVKSPE